MREKHSPELKARLVLEVLKGERLLSEIASSNDIHPNLLTRWKTKALSNFADLFKNENQKSKKQARAYEDQIDELYKQIGKLTAQIEWLKKKSEIRIL